MLVRLLREQMRSDLIKRKDWIPLCGKLHEGSSHILSRSLVDPPEAEV
jgi:hypothetical protein